MKILSIDVGGTFIKAAIIESEHCITPLERIPTPKEGTEQFIDAICALYNAHPEAEGIAMSMPGILNDETGFMYTGGSLYFIQNFDLAAAIRERCGGVKVSIANDAKAGALAELELGSLKDATNAVMLVVGTGFGGAVIIDRKVLSGSHRFAGEFSFMTAFTAQRQKKMWGKMGAGYICELYSDAESTEEVFDKAEAGDRKALNAIKKFCRQCAVMISNIQCVADPDCVAIGGAVSSRALFIDEMAKAVRKHQEDMGYIMFGMPPVKIKACAWHDNTVGAWLHFMKQQEKR